MIKLVFLISLFSCTHSSDLKINYQSENIYDIEISASKIIFLCSTPGDPKEPRSFFNIYAISNSRADSFFTRRALSIKECHEWESEVAAIMKGASKARVVGVSGGEDNFIDEDLNAKSKGKFSKVNSLWLFSRIVTDKGCVGHFGGECLEGYSEKKKFINP